MSHGAVSSQQGPAPGAAGKEVISSPLTHTPGFGMGGITALALP